MRLELRGRVALWLAVGTVCVGSLALTLAGPLGEADARTALSLAVGWSFAVAGLVGWYRRPANPTGMLMVVVGVTWLAVSLTALDVSGAFTAGVALQALPLAIFTHVLLAYPTGRLERGLPTALVAVAYLDTTAAQLANLLFNDFGRLDCPCPGNAILVRAADDVAWGIELGQRAFGVVVLGGVIAMLARRWRTASSPTRRVLAPVFATGGPTGALLLVTLVVQVFAEGAGDDMWLGVYAGLASVPFAFLVGLVRTRLARAAVGDLLVELDAVRAPGELRDAVGRALGDPSLRLAYWLPDLEAFVDVRGRPVPLEEITNAPGRAVRRVERDGRLVAALVHDATLLDQPELVDAVCAAAGLALENERLQAEMRASIESLRASEERLRALIEATPVAIVEFELDTRITLWNQAAEAIFGWTAAEVLGKPLPFVPADRRGEAEWLRAEIRAGRPITNYETVRVRKDGTVRDVLISSAAVRDSSGRVVRHMGALIDITERKRAEEELRRMEEKDRALLGAIPDQMFRFDRRGTYLDVKAERTDVLVAPVEELIGKRVDEVLPADVASRFLARIDRVLADGELQTYEYELEVAGGRRTFETRLVRSGEDEVLSIVRDITERKEAEAELRSLKEELERRLEELQASRARMVEAADAERRRLERNLHDGAQQRLVALALTLRLAQTRVKEDPEAAEKLIEAAGEELSQALAELRELARGIHPAILTDRGLAAALEALAMRAPMPVELDVALDGRLPSAVEAAAYYIVSEAIANATKYARASSVTVALSREDGRALVEVVDDGIGGADPTAGSGLRGLADRVEALEGRLEVVSPPGGGTRVRAEVPCG